MVLRNFVSFICFLLPISLCSQSPYQIDWKKEPYFLGTGVVTLSTGYYLGSRTAPLTTEQIDALNPAAIPRFDRKVTQFYDYSASRKSDFFFMSSYGLPALLLANKKTRNDFGQLFLLYSESLLITKGLTNVTKRAVKRARPYVYNEEVSLSNKQLKTSRRSFFSGHTSTTAVNYFFVAKVFSDYFPDSRLKPYVWTTAVIAPAVTGYFRVKAGKHFYSDVILGYATGAAIGFLVPHLHKKQKNGPVRFYPAPNGFALTWNLR